MAQQQIDFDPSVDYYKALGDESRLKLLKRLQEGPISLSEAATLSKLHPDHLRKLAQRGVIRARKIGRNWVTSREAVLEYLGDLEKRSRNPFKNKR